jgi:hypothetical protein
MAYFAMRTACLVLTVLPWGSLDPGFCSRQHNVPQRKAEKLYICQFMMSATNVECA